MCGVRIYYCVRQLVRKRLAITGRGGDRWSGGRGQALTEIGRRREDFCEFSRIFVEDERQFGGRPSAILARWRVHHVDIGFVRCIAGVAAAGAGNFPPRRKFRVTSRRFALRRRRCWWWRRTVVVIRVMGLQLIRFDRAVGLPHCFSMVVARARLSTFVLLLAGIAKSF